MVQAVASPLVSIVTPTWDRNNFVFRAILSVALQEYRPIQHIVVSDGPNPELERRVRMLRGEKPGYELMVDFLPEHDTSAKWGHYARMRGIELAKGDYVCYLDDDEEYLPHHVNWLAQELTLSGAGFAYSQVLVHEPGQDWVSGQEPPAYTHVSTSTIMHRREILDIATWRPGDPQVTHEGSIDWDLVKRWLDAGVKWGYVNDVTVHAHRDAPNVNSDRPRNLLEN